MPAAWPAEDGGAASVLMQRRTPPAKVTTQRSTGNQQRPRNGRPWRG